MQKIQCHVKNRVPWKILIKSDCTSEAAFYYCRPPYVSHHCLQEYVLYLEIQRARQHNTVFNHASHGNLKGAGTNDMSKSYYFNLHV